MSEDVASLCRTFDLGAEARALRQSPQWTEHGQSSRTLLNLLDLRLVMMALRSGHQIQRHQSNLRLTLTTFTGHVQLGVDDETIDLPTGNVSVLDPGVPHDVTALEDSVILLSLSRES